MQHTLFLFDIDGTLLTTSGAGVRAMRRAGHSLFGPEFSMEGIQMAGHLDPLIFAEAAALNKLGEVEGNHAVFAARYADELRVELDRSRHEVKAMPGVIGTIQALRERERARGDVMLGLLTGNYTKTAPIKLEAAGINPAWFDITAFGDEGKTRPDLVTVAMRKYQQKTGRAADPKRVVVIGDTPRDVHCAKAHHCIALGVATGGFSVEALEQSGADVAVKDLTDPGVLLNLIGG
jgi:phosphoglycolate phosphatase